LVVKETDHNFSKWESGQMNPNATTSQKSGMAADKPLQSGIVEVDVN
jgi:hypothetical protein